MQTWTIAFLLGVTLLQFLPTLPPYQWLLLAALLPVALALFNKRVAFWSLALLLGFYWAFVVAQYRLSDRLASDLQGEDVVVLGRVASLPERSHHQTRFIFEIDELRYRGELYSTPSKVRLSWYQGAPRLQPDEQWQLVVRFKRPHGMMNPGGFDYEQWLYQQGIRATGYVRSSKENHLLDDGDMLLPLQRLRYRLQQQMDTLLKGRARSGIIQALAIGERGGISDQEWSLLLATGTNHLMAISGLHIGLVAGLVYFLFLSLWRLCPRCMLVLAAPRAAALAAILAAMSYAALAGFSVPTQRAMLMLSLVMGALYWQRPMAASRLLSLVLLLVLLHDPLVVLSAGFWLSFAAVVLILYGMRGRLNPGGVWWRWGRVQWLVALGLMPLLLLLFGQASIVAPLANLIAVPWIGLLVVPLTLLGTLLLTIWDVAGVSLLELAAWLTDLIWPLLEFLAEVLPVLRLSSSPWWSYALAIIGIGWMLAPKGWPVRWSGGVLLLPLLLWKPVPIPMGEAKFTLLDVGQGLAAVVETHDHVLIFDTGPRFPSGFNTGSAVIIPFLYQRGHDKVDMLMVSHGDNDHIGGARDLVKALPVRRVLTSVSEKMSWVSHERCRRGERWLWDGVAFELLHPDRLPTGSRGNNGSCVLRVTAGEDSVMLTGDIEQEAERELIAAIGDGIAADVLVAPHHGSKTSSSEAFIDTVSPRWVLFPVGYRNRYGFPYPEIIERYSQTGVDILSTSESGAISMTLGRNGLTPSEYRKAAHRYWHLDDM